MSGEGSAYHLPPPRVLEDLVRVGCSTPISELVRRFWWPVGKSANAGAMPKRVKPLGEDLILFAIWQGGLASCTRATAIAAPPCPVAASGSGASAAATTAG